VSSGGGGTPPADQSPAAGPVWRGHLKPPPPPVTATPRLLHFEVGDKLARIYDPTSHGARELTFRSFGPRLRFDHHPPGPGDSAADHPDCGIWYGSWGPDSIRSCGIEVFGEGRRIHLRPGRLAVPVVTRRLTLVDLRGDGAMHAGATAELPKWADMRMTWAWARHFHGLTIDREPVDGIAWDSARSDLPCLALFERGADAIACPPSGVCSFPLTQPHVRDQLLTLLRDFGYTLAT
jgi:RES domain